jgi:cell wall-associated NlpC family hydrolase
MAPSIKTPIGDAPVIPVMLLLIGGYLAWFGAHYFKGDTAWPSDPIKSILQGKGTLPNTQSAEQARQANLTAYVQQYTAGSAAGSAAGSPVGSLGPGSAIGGAIGGAIAADAQKYIGSGYVFGGNASSVGNWDCSSFTSYVLGHDLNIPLPGGKWGDPGMPPHAHGPTTGSYALWGTQLNQTDVQPGDLVVWQSHMGIAISNTEIVSAQDEKLGVGTSTIAGTTASLGEPTPHFRRVP